MKQRWYIFVLALLLCSCSAEQRLAYLLKKHPELRTGTQTVTIPVEVPIPFESASLDIPWSAMPDVRPVPAAENRKSDTATVVPSPTFSVTAGHAKAILTQTDSGFVLTAEQMEDTVKAEAPAEVPIVEVHDLPMEENAFQSFFRVLGYIVGAIILLFVILFFIKKFFHL